MQNKQERHLLDYRGSQSHSRQSDLPSGSEDSTPLDLSRINTSLRNAGSKRMMYVFNEKTNCWGSKLCTFDSHGSIISPHVNVSGPMNVETQSE